MKIMIQNDIVKLCAKVKNENAIKNVNDKTSVQFKNENNYIKQNYHNFVQSQNENAFKNVNAKTRHIFKNENNDTK